MDCFMYAGLTALEPLFSFGLNGQWWGNCVSCEENISFCHGMSAAKYSATLRLQVQRRSRYDERNTGEAC